MERDSPTRRLEPHDAAERGRDPDRAPGVGSERSKAESRRDGGAAPAARSARNALEVPRVVHRAEVGVTARDPVGPLVQVVLPEQDRAGLVEALGHGCVFAGDEGALELRAGGGAHAAGPEDVLEADRNSVQRAAVPPAGDLALRPLRLLHRQLRRDRDEGVQAPPEALDAPEHLQGQIHRRQLPLAHERRQVCDRPLGAVHKRH